MQNKKLCENFVCTNLIDSGPFKGFWEVMDNETGDFHFMKTVDRSTLDTPKKVDNFSTEVSLFGSLNFRTIPKLISFFHDEEAFHIVVEKPSNPSLFERIKNDGHLTEKQCQLFALSFIETVQYLESLDPLLVQSIAVNQRGYEFTLENIYLNDDGSISQIYVNYPNFTFFNLSDCNKMRITAPETITHQKISTKLMSWFLGIVLYYSLTGVFPFDGRSAQEISNSILRHHPRYPNHLSKEIVDLINLLLIKNPQMRISLNKALDSAFLNSKCYSGNESAQKSLYLEDNLEISKSLGRNFSSYHDISIPSNMFTAQSLHANIGQEPIHDEVSFFEILNDAYVVGSPPNNQFSDSYPHSMPSSTRNSLVFCTNKQHRASDVSMNNFVPFIKSAKMSKAPSHDRVPITPRKFISPLQSFGVRRVL
ncbi:hypothetical protein TRFO_29856 [Tritrichomonas foetus]|uniref:Protein kinase domain-containing protein n=1 Tax=Tritrichomonas foetus TaxID=1144522 RepID=A0A1J4JUU7_9EUKA|nr:hypothetical protein TRFO_29856 [Tritrichomonas foetus]|eukprot:OHT02921.1 hypothetical protein TRFO_29856 [Tritrichomonas foetus]